MAHSVLRCVENGVPGIRSGNTGVSCFIDRHGRVHDLLEQPDGNTIFPGFQVSSVSVQTGKFTPTTYTKRGDVLGASSGWLAVVVLLVGVLRRRRDAGRDGVME